MKSLRSNGISSTVGSIFRLAVNVAAQPALILLLGTGRYGQWAVLIAAAMLGSVVDCGISGALTVLLPGLPKTPSGSPAFLRTSFLLSSSFGCAAGIVWLGLTGSLARWLFSSGSEAGELLTAIRVLALVPFTGVLLNWYQGWESGLRRYDIRLVRSPPAHSCRMAA